MRQEITASQIGREEQLKLSQENMISSSSPGPATSSRKQFKKMKPLKYLHLSNLGHN